MDAGGDGWERLGAGLAEGGGAKEADKRERTIISLKISCSSPEWSSR